MKNTIKNPVLFIIALAVSMIWGQAANAQVTADFTYDQSCLDFQFTDASTATIGTINDWSWDFGDGNSSTLQSPMHTYAGDGTYPVTLTVTTDNFDSDTYTQDVYITTPVAVFTYSQFCDSLEFIDASTPIGEITAWSWDFGDGASSTIQNATHTYSAPGDYLVSLTVTHNTGCISIAETQTISIAPTAMFSFNQNCDFFTFNDESTPLGDITDWSWDFGDGGSSIDQNPTYTYLIPGEYTVSLVVTNSSGCTDSTAQQVSIVPTAAFSYAQVCNVFNFTDESTPSGEITVYDWDFGDGIGFSNLQNPTYDYPNTGVYTVTLTVTHTSGCLDSTSQDVLISKPDADFTFVQFCDSLEFTDASSSSAGIEFWNWEFGDGNTSTDQNPTHTYTVPGDYTISLSITDSLGCSHSKQEFINTYPTEVGFEYDLGCLNRVSTFIDTSTTNIISGSWNIDGITFPYQPSIQYTFTTSGIHTVILSVTNDINCSDTHQEDIEIFVPPIAAFSVQLFCASDTTVFLNETDTQNVEVQSWLWDFNDPSSPDPTSGLYEPNHSFTNPGPYDVKLIVENIYGCVDSIIQTIFIDSLPEPAYTYVEYASEGQLATFIDESQAHGSFIINKYWDWGDGSAPGINVNPVTHIYDPGGAYQLCLGVTDLNGCTDTICQEIVIAKKPLADFTYTAGGITAYFVDATTIDTLTGAKEWLWTFGDDLGTSIVANPSFIFPAQGFYDVNIMVTDSLDAVHDTTKNIYVGNALIADYITDEDICYGDTSVIFDNSYSPVGDTILSWHWNFGDGHDTTYYEKASVLKHFYEIGEYPLQLIITAIHNGSDAIDSINRNIFVHPNPIAFFDSVGVCKGDIAYFYDLSDSFGDTLSSWLWDLGDGTIKTEQNPVHNYQKDSTYRVSLVVTTEYGCTDTMYQNAHVTYAPEVTFTVENACIDSPAKFVPLYSSGTYVTEWLWDFGDPNNDTTSTEESPTHVYTYFTLYDVSVTASSFGCPKTTDKTILIYPIPYSDFNMTPNYGGSQGKVMFENGSIYAENYLWDFGNGQTSSVENPIEVYEDDSTYLITLISYNEYGCSDTSRMEYYLFFKGLYFPTAFSPNNTNQEVSLFTPKGVNLAKYHVQVFDMRGNQVWESEAIDDAGRPTESWDGYYEGRLMPQGLYLWRATATFIDGTVWQGTTLQNEEPQLQGTVTLIR
ncbi:MAG: PKD domain-containing protein [Chlorobi bacterium]|nr:PKD domain-containing protein [Chlorobiota bacterium]